MLLSLSIRNFVIVDELVLEFGPGFSVLTGETGAGKSILIDALLLALGERAEADVVREGAARADITAEFRITTSAQQWLNQHDLLNEENGSLLLRRSIDANGRGKAFINGVPAPLNQLRELGELLVDVHGQHAHQSLLKSSSQQRLLDEHGGLTDTTKKVADLYAGYRRLAKGREEAEQMEGSARLEQERLQWIVDELADIAPQPGEWAEVQTEHTRLSHAANLLEGAQSAVGALSEAEDAALARIDTVAAKLTQLSSFDERLKPVLEALDSARIQVDEAARELNQYLARTEVDDQRLAQVEARVAALHAAARKFKCAPDDLPGLLAQSQQKLLALAASSDLAGLRAAEAQAFTQYQQAATVLSKARSKAATAMAREVTRAMQDLSMNGGRFEVKLEECAASATGLERVEFLVAGHAGTTPKPLAKVASGGELARISLAISVIAASATPVATLIFDEVDAGIGGAVADTVGRLLKLLGQSRQVLCVTHLPQVAARGDQHYVVSKENIADKPVSRIHLLERKKRVEELARMLGGIDITETTRKHAREMLAA